MQKPQIYLDYAAATPIDLAVRTAMEPYLSDYFYNPSALYLAAKKVDADIAAARQSIAGLIGARSSEIIFTSGATEANNLAIRGILQKHPQGNVVVSAIEHDAVLKTAQQQRHTIVAVNESGVVDLQSLRDSIDDNTVVVSVMYANNEVGTIQPMRQIARVADSIRSERERDANKTPLYLHTDASQAGNYLDLHASRLGVDLMTISAGKIYGPKQCGALYVRAGIELQPQLTGGGQEGGLRSGTENAAAVVGFAAAFELVQNSRNSEVSRLQTLQKLFISSLKEIVPNCTINGSATNRLPNNVHVTFPGQDNERLVMELDEQGIMCAAGSACSASDDEPSHVLKAMNISDEDARASLRFSMGRQTSEDDIKRTIQVLKTLIS